MTITRYTVTDTRKIMTPYVPGTAETGWSGVDAVYDAPRAETSDVVAAYKRGEFVNGYSVDVRTVGVGTTVDIQWRYESRGWDDGAECERVTYRDEAGEWITETARVRDGYSYTSVYETSVDATSEIRAAYAAHLARLDAEERARIIAQQEERVRVEARQARAEVARGKFVVVARGRNVPVGTVGRVFYCRVSDGAYPTLRAGLATTSRLDDNGRAADVAWSAASNCDVLMQEMPADPADVERLYAFAGALAAHLPDGRGAGVDAPAEVFPREWERACAEPWRLAVFAAYSPADLTTELRRAAREHRSIDEVLECVESSPDARDALASLVTARAQIPATDAEGLAAWRRAVRAVIVPCVGVVYVPRPAKARASKANAYA